MRTVLLLIAFQWSLSLVFSQTKPNSPALSEDQFANVVEQSFALYYADYAKKQNESYESVIAKLNYQDGQVVSFSDEVYCERIKEINKLTPFKLECNEATLSTIRFFVANRRGFARIVLGRSRLYFDMYEAKLAEHGLPLELKYLSVIESGLRPQVKSRAGALGLWQFMYGTGKMFGLRENSYIDERMDPEKSTEAACKYLKQLFNIYGDWNLALAAYNAGPGNVNKAIRRSGNKTTYWEVRPFLPKETQGYVPNFIAATYLLTYHAEHNIIPAEAPIHYAELDSICLSKGVHMSTINKLLGWEVEEIKALNPVYKASFIPETNPKQCIYGPIKHIGKLVTLEDSLYNLEQSIYNAPKVTTPVAPVEVVEGDSTVATTNPGSTTAGNTFYHKVQSGETLTNIATKYGTTVNQIMTLNGLSNANIYVGQRLKIESTKTGEATTNTPVARPEAATSTQPKYYIIKSGDTFGKVAQRHGKSISQLRQLNPGVNIDRLKLGQKIRVK